MCFLYVGDAFCCHCENLPASLFAHAPQRKNYFSILNPLVPPVLHMFHSESGPGELTFELLLLFGKNGILCC